MISIPLTTPLGRTVKSIGVWMSGGADSSLLCYMLAEKIKQENLPIKIQPLTVDHKRPFTFIAGTVSSKIIELLDAKDIFHSHIVYNPPEGITWTLEEHGKQFHSRNYENFKNDKFQILYCGTTTNPPVEIQEKFSWSVIADIEAKRGVGVIKEPVRYFTKEEDSKIYEFMEFKPFIEIDKKEIARMYQEKNLMETLFPLTRSCELPGTVVGHCGTKCWWCEERAWAFGRLE
jgi:hypothetical protein